MIGRSDRVRTNTHPLAFLKLASLNDDTPDFPERGRDADKSFLD
jgi:hypothetical protein